MYSFPEVGNAAIPYAASPRMSTASTSCTMRMAIHPLGKRGICSRPRGLCAEYDMFDERLVPSLSLTHERNEAIHNQGAGQILFEPSASGEETDRGKAKERSPNDKTLDSQATAAAEQEEGGQGVHAKHLGLGALFSFERRERATLCNHHGTWFWSATGENPSHRNTAGKEPPPPCLVPLGGESARKVTSLACIRLSGVMN